MTLEPLHLPALARVDAVLLQHAPARGGLLRNTDWHLQHVEITW